VPALSCASDNVEIALSCSPISRRVRERPRIPAQVKRVARTARARYVSQDTAPAPASRVEKAQAIAFFVTRDLLACVVCAARSPRSDRASLTKWHSMGWSAQPERTIHDATSGHRHSNRHGHEYLRRRPMWCVCLLNEQSVPTRERISRWDRSRVWLCCATQPIRGLLVLVKRGSDHGSA
jgi:hypothetical protein